MAEQQKVDVHELAALPYGKAEAEIKKAGLWCERLGGEGEMKRYRVKVTGTARVVQHVTVEARSKEKAEEEAMDVADTDQEWEVVGDCDADDAEVVS